MKRCLFFGGWCEERLVSLASAKNVASQYSFDQCFYIAQNGQVHQVLQDQLQHFTSDYKTEFNSDSSIQSWTSIEEAIQSLPNDACVFLAVHGKNSEDGYLQACLEKANISFTGSGSAASQLAFDKSAAKEALNHSKLRMAESLVVNSETISKIFNQYNGKDIVLKPIHGGSSVGVVFAKIDAENPIDLGSYRDFLLEERVFGREFTCGVISRGATTFALCPIEIKAENNNFDFSAKYMSSITQEIIPPDIDADLQQRIESAALIAHEGLGCYGYSRSDFMYDGHNLYYLETNTLPGLTQQSLITKELRHAGISMKEFVDEQMRLARLRN